MSDDLFDDTPQAPPKRVPRKKPVGQSAGGLQAAVKVFAEQRPLRSPQPELQFGEAQALPPTTTAPAAPTSRTAPTAPTLPDLSETSLSKVLRHDRVDAAQLMAVLDSWVQRGWLRELDRAFADFLWREAPDAHPLLLLGAALASHQLGRGHVCLDLAATLDDPGFALSLPPEGDASGDMPLLPGIFLDGLRLAGWLAALDHQTLVSEGERVEGVEGVEDATPMVRVGSRLYLRRYWQYEQQVREAIDMRMAGSVALQAALPTDTVRGMLDRLFPSSGNHDANWQKLACALAASRRFSVITGGPGTGKTTTVVKLLALLQSLALRREWRLIDTRVEADAVPYLTVDPTAALSGLRIRLAAPTGKAAARLNESIAKAVQALPLEGLLSDSIYDMSDADADADAPGADMSQATLHAVLRAAIPTAVTTLHRLLGSRPDTRHFTHNARRPLPLDVLVIDEASMVDLEMMSAVLAALPPAAQLILLGDKDQLSSVEAGAVLGELCRHAKEGRYTPTTRDWLKAATGETLEDALCDAHGQPLDQAVAMLRRSYRFTAQSGIGQLAAAVNDGDIARTRNVWKRRYADLSRLYLPMNDETVLRNLVLYGAADGFPETASATKSAPVGYQHYLRVMRDTQPSVMEPVASGLDHAARSNDRADILANASAPDPATGFAKDSANDIAGDAALDAWARNVLEAHAQFQILCALRKGAFGVEGLNHRIEAILHAQGLIRVGALWYAGRPVLVTRNDYSLGLMNGDVGMTFSVPAHAGAGDAVRLAGTAVGAPGVADTDRSARHLRVAFLSGDGSKTIRWILPSRLQAVETVYAMTVHKSQGSEFAHAALVLPERLNPILTRELIYTGITRARQWFSLASAGSTDRVFEEAIQRRVLRASGLVASDPDGG